MSLIFKVSTSQRIEIEDLINILRQKRIFAFYIDKSPVFHIYEEGFSTRGVEITEEDYGYEIRMTVLSSANDFLLSNEIAFILCSNLNGRLTDKDGNEKYIGTLFTDLDIHRIMQSDFDSILALLNHGEEIEISGPVRQFSFGPKIKEKILALNGNSYALTKGLSKMILACQFPPEEFIPFSNFLKIGEGENAYFLQVLTNSKKMVVEKVKHYAVSTGEASSIIIDMKDLGSIVPEEWQHLDDYTFLASPISSEKWAEFVAKATSLKK